MVIKTKNFKINDKNKLEVELLHDFKPLEEYNDVVIKCEYLKNGELPRYFDIQEKTVDFVRIFKEKAKSVEGIELEDPDGKKIKCDVNTIVAMPNQTFNEIIMKTSAHLVEAYTLTAIVDGRGSTGDIENVTTAIAAVSEAYPELKSNENYKQLMNELSMTENLIAEYRSNYNKQIKEYNRYTRKFPTRMFLSMLGYEVQEYTYLNYDAPETAPQNLFGE